MDVIRVYGTSHVSEESLDLIQQKIEEHDPDIVALELDFARLQGLLNGERNSRGPLFIRAVRWFQEWVGSRTGVMPGDEMVHAYEIAARDGREIALIDQDIQVTVSRLKSVSTAEKVRAGLHFLAGFFGSAGFDISKIPEEELVEQLLEQMRFKFPGLYRVLVEERNRYMVRALEKLQEDNPDSDIIAFVGAAHSREIREAFE